MNTTRADGESLTVLKSVTNEFEAALIVNALEEHGIRSTAAGDFTSGFRAEAPGGVRVFVKSADVAAALEALRTTAESGRHDLDIPDTEEPADALEVDIAPELVRAWQAAVVGLLFIPVLATGYSLYLLFRYRLLTLDQRSGNWRAPAALAVNVLALVIDALLIWYQYFRAG